MKKIIIFLFIVFFSFVCACDDKKQDETPNGEQTPVSKENAIGSDYNSSKVERKVTSLKNDKGFYVEYKVENSYIESGEEIVALGANHNTYFFINSMGEMIYDLSDATKIVYFGKEEEEWHKIELLYGDKDTPTKAQIKQTIDSLMFGVILYMTSYRGLMNETATKSSDTILDRECNKYVVNYSSWGSNEEISIWIDKETGICLKQEVVDSSTGEVVTSMGSTFECVCFKMEYDIVLPKEFIVDSDE